MNGEHRPSPEFVTHLEWQLRAALQRTDRFSQPVRSKRGGTMKMITLVLVSALLGAGGVVVKDEVQEARAQELLVAKTAAELELAQLELEIMMSQLQEVERQYQSGTVGEEALLMARTSLQQTESRLSSLQLDLEEIRETGKEPQNEISSPLVGNRDFVTERLELQEDVAEASLQVAQLRLTRLQDLRDSGAVSEIEFAQGFLALREAEAWIDELRNRVETRSDFIDGEVSAQGARRRFEIFETANKIELMRAALDEATFRYQQMEERVESGLVRETELQKMRLQVMQVETQLQFLQMKLNALTLERRLP
jgi:hypothetical protein